MDIQWSGVVASIKKVAPMLGSLIGGPAGGAVGVIAGSAVGRVLLRRFSCRQSNVIL